VEKENILFGIRTIIEAIQAGTAVDKVFIQKEIQYYSFQIIMAN